MTAQDITTNAKTMRYHTDGSIELYEYQVDDPDPGEVQLRGGACGICSWDIATAKYGDKVPMALAGHEGVGHVAKVGPGVTSLKEGDRVAGGGFTIVNSSPSSKLRAPFPPAIRLIHRGVFDLRPLVTHLTPLDDYAALMARILSGEGGYVKGVVSLA
jgi:threonine dehydrogenase-like Zn-dependent dehydrogenase